jgi:hypothetical protein
MLYSQLLRVCFRQQRRIEGNETDQGDGGLVAPPIIAVTSLALSDDDQKLLWLATMDTISATD